MVQSLSIHAHKSETHVNNEIIFDDRKFGWSGPGRVRVSGSGPVRSGFWTGFCRQSLPRPPCATQQSHAAVQPPEQPRNQQKEPSSHQSKQQQQQQPQEKPSSSRSNQPAPSTLLSTFLPRPGGANICNLEPGAAPGAVGPIV